MMVCTFCGSTYYDHDYNCPACERLYQEDLDNNNIPCPEVISKENFTWPAWVAYKSLLIQAKNKEWSDDFTRSEVLCLMRRYEAIGNDARAGKPTQSQVEQEKHIEDLRNLGKDLFNH